MGARRRLPVHPMLSKLRTLGTLAILFGLLATFVTTSRAGAQVDGNAYRQVAKVEDILQKLESTSSKSDTASATSIRDDERTPNIFDNSTETESEPGRITFDSGNDADASREGDTVQDNDKAREAADRSR